MSVQELFFMKYFLFIIKKCTLLLSVHFYFFLRYIFLFFQWNFYFLARVFPIEFFTARAAKFRTPVFFTRNEHQFMTFIAVETAQNFLPRLDLRQLPCFIIINPFMMLLAAMRTAVQMIISPRFKSSSAYRTYFFHQDIIYPSYFENVFYPPALSAKPYIHL